MLQQSKKEIVLQENNSENALAIYLEDEPINYIPEKDSGYTLDLSKSSCTNGVEISFDYNTWSVKTNYENYESNDNTRVKCSLYFKKRTFSEAVVDCGALSKDAGTCIKENYYLTDEVVSDETSDNNLRFIGANPDNYVWFNNELWRIIGVMNNIDDGTGVTETRLKIIRDEPIGQYSWDNKGEYGENDWTTSSIQIVLNSGAYYNRTSGECPSGQNSGTTICDFTSAGLTGEAKAMISNAVWNLGGLSSSSNIPSTFYKSERETTVYNERPTTWIGQIGLMYPSDYGYATSGGSTGRETCLSYNLESWDDYNDCYNYDWLYTGHTGFSQWTLTPRSSSTVTVFSMYSYGIISYGTSNDVSMVYPVTYLISNVKITSGFGTKELPFLLEI